MEKVNDGFLRFFDAGELIAKKFDMSKPPEQWIPAYKIAEIIGVPVTHGSSIQIGHWAKDNGIKAKKTNRSRFLAMPPLKTEPNEVGSPS